MTGTNVPDLPGVSFGMIIQIQIEGLGMAHSRLIGVESGAFLIVKTPPITDIATKLYEKNHVVVRYFHSGWVHAFRCTLLSLIKEPLRMAVLSYPEEIEKMNIRKHDRVDCNIPVEAVIESLPYRGVVRNISTGGLSLEIDKENGAGLPQANVSDIIYLAMHREENQTTSIEGIVRNIQIDRTKMIIGLEYYHHSAEPGQNKIGNGWLDNLISENL